jgi:hypothetical protein
MDYLSIQASSVPSERVFSSGSETITKRRNHLCPTMMEALQMTKFFLKKQRLGGLDFTKGWIALEQEMAQEDCADEDLLVKIIDRNLATNHC